MTSRMCIHRRDYMDGGAKLILSRRDRHKPID